MGNKEPSKKPRLLSCVIIIGVLGGYGGLCYFLSTSGSFTSALESCNFVATLVDVVLGAAIGLIIGVLLWMVLYVLWLLKKQIQLGI